MLRGLFVLAILIPGIVAALTDRYKALLLYLWFGFFRPQEWVWFDIAQYRLSFVLALILVVPAFVTATFPNLTHPLSIGMVSLLGCGLVAQLNAVNQAVGWRWIQFFAQLTLVCLLAITLVKTPRHLLRVVAVLAGSLGFFAAKAGLFSLVSGGVQFGAGLSGAFTDSNGYALGSVMIIPLLVLVGQNAELTFEGLVPRRMLPAARYACFVAAALCVYAVISTFSRGGFLALIAAALAFVWLHPRRVALTLALAVAAAVMVRFVPLPEGYTQRLESIPVTPIDDNEDGSNPLEDTAEGRLHFWRVAMDMVADHPLGIGMRNYESTYDSYDHLNGVYGRRRAVHSAHFQVLAEFGYLGALIWTAMFIYAFRVVFRVRKASRTPGLSPPIARFLLTASTGLLVSMVGFLVGSSFISMALNDLTWLTFAMLAALDRMAPKLCAEAAPGAKAPIVSVNLRPNRVSAAPSARQRQGSAAHGHLR